MLQTMLIIGSGLSELLKIREATFIRHGVGIIKAVNKTLRTD